MSFNADKKNSKAEEWGKVKFVPKVAKRSNPFSGSSLPENNTSEIPRNKFKGGFVRKPQQNRNPRFTPKDAKFLRPPRECPATPWKKFKDELVDKQREEESSNAVDMNSTEAQGMLKKREENYRRNLITSQTKEPTKWESFDDDDNTVKASSSKKKVNKLLQNIDLKNFKSTNLNFKQNNQFRRHLTKAICVSDPNLELSSIVKDMKHQKEVRNGFKKQNKRK